jgi:hypothetical protein
MVIKIKQREYINRTLLKGVLYVFIVVIRKTDEALPGGLNKCSSLPQNSGGTAL